MSTTVNITAPNLDYVWIYENKVERKLEGKKVQEKLIFFLLFLIRKKMQGKKENLSYKLFFLSFEQQKFIDKNY